MLTPIANTTTAAIIARVEHLSGCPVTLLRDPTLQTLATVKAANRYQPSHIIRYRDDPVTAAYQIAFECGFLLRMYTLPPQDRVQLIGTANARERVAKELRRLRTDLPPASIQTVTDMLYDGLMLQLRSCGSGLEVDSLLFAQYPALRPLQAVTMEQQVLTNVSTLDPDLDRQFPHSLVQASRAMNSAYALFAAELLRLPHLAVPYQSVGFEAVGRELLSVLFQGPDEGTPDRQIVDAWAKTLGLCDWYQWDPVERSSPEPVL
ncbi:MAG: hypothetical protein IPN92_10655 [Chromatiaceae bacterium]|nr:hypothetical protein [Chromatiaceae bacterium]